MYLNKKNGLIIALQNLTGLCLFTFFFIGIIFKKNFKSTKKYTHLQMYKLTNVQIYKFTLCFNNANTPFHLGRDLTKLFPQMSPIGPISITVSFFAALDFLLCVVLSSDPSRGLGTSSPDEGWADVAV